MYKLIRYARIIISILVTLLITLAVLNVGNLTAAAGAWLVQAQLIPAILALSAVWIVFWTAVTLCFGRIYCSIACPLGLVQDIISAISRKCTKHKTFRFAAPKTYLRVIALLVFVEGTSLGLSFITEYLDPFNCYQHLLKVFIGASAAGWLTAIIIFAVLATLSWRNGRLLCNTICPVGAALGAVSHVSMLHFDINPDLCTHCGKCEDVCKGLCIKQTVSLVDNSRCVSCFNCVSACPCNAISYRGGRHRLQWPLMQRIATSSPMANIEQSTSNLSNQHNTSSNETIS